MAGEWIKMRIDLHDDPAVFKIAAAVKLDRFAVVGRLFAFWAWADRHAVDGRVDGASSAVVDDIVRHEGFAAALESVNWLAVTETGIAIPHYDRHNGESAKERSLKNARQARWRANRDGDVDAAPSTGASTREEKRREEKSSSKALVADATPEAPKKTNGSHVLIPDCPHEKIIALYREHCPTLNDVKTWGEPRKALARSRWRETFQRLHLSSEAEGLEWFADFFAAVNKSTFLTGRGKGKDGVAPWAADLEWLLRPSNFAKTLDGNYWDRT